MKKQNISLVIGALVAALVVITSCTQSDIGTKENGVAARPHNLIKVSEEYKKEIETYREKIDLKISLNEKKIEKFLAHILNESKESSTQYRELIAKLQQKNSDMKKKIDEYKLIGKNNWEKVKPEFDNALIELDAAFTKISLRK